MRRAKPGQEGKDIINMVLKKNKNQRKLKNFLSEYRD